MRAVFFALLFFGLFFATVVDVSGSSSRQVIVITGQKVVITNVTGSPSFGLVDGEVEVASAQKVQIANTSVVVVEKQNNLYISDASTEAEVRTGLTYNYEKQALVSPQSGKEVKVAPSVAVKPILAKKVKVEIKNITLTDDGKVPAYEVSAVSTGNLFFVVPVKMEVKYKIDATNGAIVSEEKPWWSFLVWYESR